ncbi:Fic family protein [Rhodovulum marinum]|uniref:Fic/DOC family protein n=1 Tax=Rhodovulum marinum TaxID=320662 RepID=A0A4R2Q6T9_9RHOB|nr:Fic family protein [Rhodovulum marinum]TCP42415.1 Fic/DOC family protein [Rhodovulum marinum]
MSNPFVPVAVPDQGLPAARVEALLACRPRAGQVALLCDTRPLHRLLGRYRGGRGLNAGRAGRAQAGSAGRYRGVGEHVAMRMPLPGAPIVTAGCPPEAVAARMARLSDRIGALLGDLPAPDRARAELVAIFTEFLLIHPYMDGNGRVARILFRRGAALLDLPLSPRWTLDARPYGAGLSMSLLGARRAPQMMDRFMDRYFADPRAAG